MADPAVVSSKELWIDYTKPDKNGNPTIYYSKPPQKAGGLFGSGNYDDPNIVHVTQVTYETGEIFDFKDDDTSNYVGTDKDLASRWTASQKAQVPTAAKTMKWSDPNDGSEWIIDSTTGSKIQQLSGAIPGYQPGLGVQRPAQQAQSDPSDIEYQQLQSEALRQKLYGGQLFEYDRQSEEEKRRQQEQQWQKTFGLSQAQFDYKKQADEMDRQRQAQELAQRKREAAWAAANDMNNSQLKALPYAAMPGQQYQVGYEPGGVMQNIAGMSGRGYDAEKYRAPIIQYDPEEAWRKAMGMLGQ